ncbi:WecB/TagA/CpsF family glycosyltransferase [Heyndrickxia oleronia]|uniref:N-acetylglucosaminyldiphosphoundecaprenol N-acetyl-beta-D-mannosaminyltransferase n=1 Tax=Heyndrickxia oleronia TaxID=38875 RepID=A0A8E2I745_9BACI|nr:WecB/TagA/CpsF family glycosyltransferase [Heyndrickxia oleronia]OJH19194.1 glycosyltransferase [Bacillus obstructivus]MBU5210781.1 WecB/TagA/CpsF family glycosyltransferase [Heyndrickxia oleronia]MEC1377444.1 WecB/TagA/CpsF family glycosyltransferase [Heyndrickxia oleronia]OOP67278.1 glycosyltransferase [Heyndrickxia oleronia]QQZ02893.1 WecB/TagA/CpsF family glycosyltransferase [Heyndrickxia oleronia]
MNQSAKIMGISFPKLTLNESLQILNDVVNRNKSELFHVVTGNPEIVMSYQSDQQLRKIIDEAGLVTADGIGIIMVSRIKGEQLPERVTGCDMLIRLLEMGNLKKWSFYFLGADEQTSLKTMDIIHSKYPKVTILGRHHGFYRDEEEQRIVEEIHSLGPDFLIVATGAPKAEHFIYKYKNKLNAKIAIGVGGSLDIISGKVKRAPLIWQKLNLEWLYRLIQQPSRWRRQLILPKFALKALFYKEKNGGNTIKQ